MLGPHVVCSRIWDFKHLFIHLHAGQSARPDRNWNEARFKWDLAVRWGELVRWALWDTCAATTWALYFWLRAVHFVMKKSIFKNKRIIKLILEFNSILMLLNFAQHYLFRKVELDVVSSSPAESWYQSSAAFSLSKMGKMPLSCCISLKCFWSIICD